MLGFNGEQINGSSSEESFPPMRSSLKGTLHLDHMALESIMAMSKRFKTLWLLLVEIHALQKPFVN
jgi:hypothetical protein